jgi:hypothetical protein
MFFLLFTPIIRPRGLCADSCRMYSLRARRTLLQVMERGCAEPLESPLASPNSSVATEFSDCWRNIAMSLSAPRTLRALTRYGLNKSLLSAK